MSYLRAAGEVGCHLCFFLFSIAVFLLWGSLAVGAGFVLLHLPDVWAMHSNDENSRYAVMSVTAYALIVGALFLIFVAGSVDRLCDAARVARAALKHLREIYSIRIASHAQQSEAVAHPVRDALRRWMFS